MCDFKVGDECVIIETSDHCFSLGEAVRIISVNERAPDIMRYVAKDKDGLEQLVGTTQLEFKAKK